jgi:hypothetical protein
MNNDPFEMLQDDRSFQTFGFSRRIKQTSTFVEVLVLLAYALVMVLSLPLMFI